MRKRLVGWLVTVAWSGTSALFYNAWSLLYAFSVTQPTYIGVMGRVSPAAMSSENGGDASEYSARYTARSLPCLPSMKKHVSGRQGITGTSTTYLGTLCSQYCHVDILFTYLNLTEWLSLTGLGGI
jgi:hypothetical protein